MSLDTLPIFERLKDSQKIIIAGAGGGFDIFCGLPLYFYLRERGKTVTLANLSFSSLYRVGGRNLTPQVVEVNADSEGSERYFPEKHLSRWFREELDEEVPIWCFHRTGYLPLAEAYEALADETKADTVILVDGGTDSLMRGDEASLGTPQEDIASLTAVSNIKYHVKQRFLISLGFGVDTFHGICHAQFLRAVAELIKTNGYLGTISLLSDSPEIMRYREAAEFVFNAMPDSPSIVSTSITAAIEGEFGNVHYTKRTTGSKLFISPLMAMMWAFDLKTVMERCLYIDMVKSTKTYRELTFAIEAFREGLEEKQEWEDIPL